MLKIGTISHGTMKVQDTAPALLAALDSIKLSAEDRNTCFEVEQCLDTLREAIDDGVDSDNQAEIEGCISDLEVEMYDVLVPLAETYAPDYCYVGSHPGDGSDLGVWPCEDLFDDTTQGSFDGSCWRLRTNNHPSEENIPDDMSHALSVNDHGNATLYRRSGSDWAECWAIV